MNCENRIEIESFIEDIEECVAKHYSESECQNRLKNSSEEILEKINIYEGYFIRLIKYYKQEQWNKGVDVSKKSKDIEDWIQYLKDTINSNHTRENKKALEKIRYAFDKILKIHKSLHFDDFEKIYLWSLRWNWNQFRRDLKNWKISAFSMILLPLLLVVWVWKYVEPISWLYSMFTGKK